MGNELSTGSLRAVSHRKPKKRKSGGGASPDNSGSDHGGGGAAASAAANGPPAANGAVGGSSRKGAGKHGGQRGGNHHHQSQAHAAAAAAAAADAGGGGADRSDTLPLEKDGSADEAEDKKGGGGGGGRPQHGSGGKGGRSRPPPVSEASATSFGDKRDRDRQAKFAASGRYDPPVIEDALSDVRTKYHIAPREIGHGHYGVVRKCMDRQTREWFAIKSIRKSKVGKIEVLRREVGLLREVSHPNIIALVDVYEDAKYLHLVTELCTGGELFDRIIAKTQSDEGHFSERDAAVIVRCILDAIAYCHDVKQIVHRDLKPENFLFKTEADDADIKIIDFGLSRHDTQNYGVMKTKVGTPYYVAPEVLNREYTKSCDIWSIGVITYILLCGYPPFYGDNDNQIFDSVRAGRFDFPSPDWDNISDAAKEFICAMLRKDPRMRLSAAAALRHQWIREKAPVVVAAPPPAAAAAAPSSSTAQEAKREEGKEATEDSAARRASAASSSSVRIRHQGGHSVTFRRYRGMQKLKKAALAHIAAHLTQSEVGSLGNIFRAMDEDGDGIITLRELDVAISSAEKRSGGAGGSGGGGGGGGGSIDPVVRSELRRLREDLQLTGEDTLNWRDFLASTMDRSYALKEDKIKNAFEHFKRTDGECLLVPDLVDMFGGEGHAREIIGEVDDNHDGRITYEQFRRMLTESFNHGRGEGSDDDDGDDDGAAA